ncbi:transmembrane protein 183 [Anopheles cruzii]|uniref:transmembrane protein 183 n=1 Tax=Anopheles cruzii TaxID=68878 RepID=UPI0022EC792C|nr:transmembrane protein 183 [Anopheles cruzii]
MASCVKQTKNRASLGKDVSIFAYADSPRCTNRASKAHKKVDTSEITMEPHCDDADPDHISKSVRKRKTAATDDAAYNDYHINIWFHISDHIRPEDIGRFACICRKTAEVVESGRFWSQLYRSYYDPKVDLPARFQPESMVRRRGLRAAVIRSLFYLYPPFSEQLKIASLVTDRVVGRQMLSAWHKRTKNCWTYYFRLKARQQPGSRPALSAELQRQRNSLAFMQDIYMNPEEGCQILMLTTDCLKMIPMYSETLFVKNLTQTLSQSMMRYKVRIVLANYCGKMTDELVFDAVRNVTVLDWWNPKYDEELAWTVPTNASELDVSEELDWNVL